MIKILGADRERFQQMEHLRGKQCGKCRHYSIFLNRCDCWRITFQCRFAQVECGVCLDIQTPRHLISWFDNLKAHAMHWLYSHLNREIATELLRRLIETLEKGYYD